MYYYVQRVCCVNFENIERRLVLFCGRAVSMQWAYAGLGKLRIAYVRIGPGKMQ